MNPGLFFNFLSSQAKVDRREMLEMTGKLGMVGALTALGLLGEPGKAAAAHRGSGGGFGDTLFDFSNLGSWVPGPYGAGDQRGSFNEVTPDKTASALRGTLNRGRAVKTYQLGELMWNGFPAFATVPRRIYEQRLTMAGYTPPPQFAAEGGIVHPFGALGSNQLSLHEERFAAEQSPGFPPLSTTYQIATQLDNLNHIGFREFFYNGFRGPDIARGYGTSALGSENMGPIVTRGLLLDVLGLKVARGDTADIVPASNGRPVLRSNYRITLEDLYGAMEFGRIRDILPGDAVMIRTGWNQLLKRVNRQTNPADIARWNGAGGLPGIYLAEGQYLLTQRPALVASDSWALEVLGSPDNIPGTAFPVHQDLIMRGGIRIGESVSLDGLAEDRVYEFVYMVTPQFAEGATCGNTAPAALGQPRH